MQGGTCLCVLSDRGRSIQHRVSYDSTLVKCWRGGVVAGNKGRVVTWMDAISQARGWAPYALFFCCFCSTKMQYSFCLQMKSKGGGASLSVAAAAAGALSRRRSAASTSSGESRAIRRICRIRGHPLAAQDNGNSFPGSEAKHSATARRNPPIF